VKKTFGINNTKEKHLQISDFKEFYSNISNNLKSTNRISNHLSNLKTANSNGKTVTIAGSFSGKRSTIKNTLGILIKKFE